MGILKSPVAASVNVCRAHFSVIAILDRVSSFYSLSFRFVATTCSTTDIPASFLFLGLGTASSLFFTVLGFSL